MWGPGEMFFVLLRVIMVRCNSLEAHDVSRSRGNIPTSDIKINTAGHLVELLTGDCNMALVLL